MAAVAEEQQAATTSEALAEKVQTRCVLWQVQNRWLCRAKPAPRARCITAFAPRPQTASSVAFACGSTTSRPQPPPHHSSFSLDDVEPELAERFRLCRSVAEECVTDADLLALLRFKPNPVAYDGFEPSGRMHIAQVGVGGGGLWRCLGCWWNCWSQSRLLSFACMHA